MVEFLGANNHGRYKKRCANRTADSQVMEKKRGKWNLKSERRH